MDSNDKISIIIPVHNMSSYLKKCVESVCAQTYKNLEIILINYESTDGSDILCNQLKEKDKRIVVLNQKNKGISHIRNVGIKAATGKYLGFVDADDYIDRTMFEKLIFEIKKTNADIACCNFNFFINDNIHKKNNTKKRFIYSREESLSKLAEGKIILDYVWNKIYKRELFNDIRFPDNKIFEDLFVMPKVFLKIKKLVYIDESLYFYRMRDNSIVGKKSLKGYYDLIEAFEDNINNPKLYRYKKYFSKRLLRSISQIKCEQFNPVNKPEHISKINKQCNIYLKKYCTIRLIGIKRVFWKWFLYYFWPLYKIKYIAKYSNSKIIKKYRDKKRAWENIR